MKQPIRYNDGNGNVKLVYGLKDYIDINDENMKRCGEYLQDHLDRIIELEKGLKKAKKGNRILTILVIAGATYGYKKITELEDEIKDLKFKKYLEDDLD